MENDESCEIFCTLKYSHLLSVVCAVTAIFFKFNFKLNFIKLGKDAQTV